MLAAAVVAAGAAVVTVHSAGADANAAVVEPAGAPAGVLRGIVRPTGNVADDDGFGCNYDVKLPGYNIGLQAIESVGSVKCTGYVAQISIYLYIYHVWDTSEFVFAQSDVVKANVFDATAHGVYAARGCNTGQPAVLQYYAKANIRIDWGGNREVYWLTPRTETIGVFC